MHLRAGRPATRVLNPARRPGDRLHVAEHPGVPRADRVSAHSSVAQPTEDDAVFVDVVVTAHVLDDLEHVLLAHPPPDRLADSVGSDDDHVGQPAGRIIVVKVLVVPLPIHIVPQHDAEEEIAEGGAAVEHHEHRPRPARVVLGWDVDGVALPRRGEARVVTAVQDLAAPFGIGIAPSLGGFQEARRALTPGTGLLGEAPRDARRDIEEVVDARQCPLRDGGWALLPEPLRASAQLLERVLLRRGVLRQGGERREEKERE